jgi:hypothetical protein
MREEIIGDCRLILGDCRDILQGMAEESARREQDTRFIRHLAKA